MKPYSNDEAFEKRQESEALQYAASKLPSSPAGEMGSEPTPDCCGGIGPCKYCTPDAAVPEPLSADISGPKGSGGAAPEAAAASHVALPCNCQHCGAIDKSQHSLVCPARLSDDYVQELRARAAASIAPAAQELVEELRVALAWALPLARLAMESHRQLRLRAGHTNIGDGRERNKTEPLLGLWDSEVDSIDQACAALARAERKEGEAKHV